MRSVIDPLDLDRPATLEWALAWRFWLPGVLARGLRSAWAGLPTALACVAVGLAGFGALAIVVCAAAAVMPA